MSFEKDSTEPKMARRLPEGVDLFYKNDNGKLTKFKQPGQPEKASGEPFINPEHFKAFSRVCVEFMGFVAVNVGKIIGYIVGYVVIVGGTIVFYIFIGLGELVKGIVNVARQQVGGSRQDWFYPETKMSNKSVKKEKAGSPTNGQGNIIINQTFNN